MPQTASQDLPYRHHVKELLGMKRPREALLVCLKWVEAKPLNGDAWFFKAVTETQTHKPEGALRSVDRALQLQPDNELTLAWKAQILAMLGQTRQCLEIITRLLDNIEQQPQILLNIGLTLSNIGRHQQAADILERVHKSDPENVECLTSLATSLHVLGRSEEAAELHQQAIEIQPGNFRAYWLLGQMTSGTPEKNFIDLFADTLERNNKALQARICLNFALAKQYEDVGEYDKAFASLQQGSAGVLEHTPYSEEQDERMQAMIRRCWSGEFFARQKKGYEAEQVIFVVGMPRTGTTLLEQIITTYDGIETAGELHHFSRLLNDACHECAPDSGADNIYESIDRVDFEKLGRDYVGSARLHVPDSHRFIDKYPLNFLMLGAILTALPNAKVINLRRNPMDTCFSNYKLLFGLGTALYSYNLLTLGAYYRRYDELMKHWHEKLPGRILDVQYEKLVTEPEAETLKVADYLGLEWRPECLNFYKSDRAVATASITQVRRPINTGSLHKWLKFERHLEPLAAYFREHGIVPDGDPVEQEK
jgi:tetratricopeptide (TPR) repeat protein